MPADANRAELIATIAEKLSAALLPEDVAAVLIADALPALGAHAGFVAGLDRSEVGLELLAPRDLAPEASAAVRSFTKTAAGALAAAAEQPRPVTVTVTLGDDADRVLPGSETAMAALGAGALVAVPLVSDGQLVGALAAGYRTQAAQDHELLARIATMAAQALGRARKYERERSTAELLQRDLLPPRVPTIERLEVGLLYRPARADLVGGDWYDVIPMRDSRVLLVMGDVAGHGVAAATTMAMLRQGARALAAQRPTPDVLLDQLSDVVHATDNKITTLALAIVDIDECTLTWSSAGHPPPLLVTSDGRGRWLAGPSRPPLGVRSSTPTSLGVEVMTAGTTLVLYTDGLVERRGESVDVGLGRLAALAGELGARPVAELERTLSPLLEAGARDDVAALAVRFAD